MCVPQLEPTDVHRHPEHRLTLPFAARSPRRELVADTPTRTDRRARSPSNDQLAAGIDSEDEPEPDTDNGSDTSASPPGPARTRAFADYHFPARAAPQPPSGPRAVADFKDYLRAVQSFSTLVAGIRLPNAPSLGDILSLDLRLAGALRRTSELETASIGRDRAICALQSLVDLLREAGWDAAGRRDIEP